MMLKGKEEKEIGEAAKETDILFHQDATVRWIFLYRSFWQLAFLVFFVAAIAYLFFKSKPSVPTPFVGSMIDLLDLKSRWVIPDLLETGYMFFVLSALFVLALTYLLYQLFYSAVLSQIEEVMQDVGTPGALPIKVAHRFIRIFKLQPVRLLPTPVNLQKNIWRRLFWYGTFLLFAVMLVSNMVLFTYFFRLLREPDMDLTGGLFSTVYLLAIISRLLCFFLSVSTVLQFVYHDFAVRVGKFTADFLPYFYPPIISVAIIAFVFSKLAQFDDFFIELVQSPGNLLLFTLFLFPVSLAIIWFGPVYSFFTDQKFAHRADSWNVAETHLRGKTSAFSRLGIFGWLVLHERLYGVKPANVEPISPPKYYLPLQNTKIPPPTTIFFSTGRLLGVVYLFSLISICTGIYLGNNSALAPFSTLVSLVSLGLVLAYWGAIQRSFSRAIHPDNLSDRLVSENKTFYFKPWQWWYNLRDREDDKLKDTKIYWVNRKWTFWLGLASVGFSLLFFLLTLWKSMAGAAWQVTFGYFLGFLLVSIFSFVWLVMYITFYDRFTFDAGRLKSARGYADEGKRQDMVQCDVRHGNVGRWDRALDFIGYSSTQAMLIFIWLVASGFILFFFYGMFSGRFLSSAILQQLNPLNIYLLLINGFIGLLLIVGRFLLLRDLSLQHAFYSQPENEGQKYDTISVMNFFRGVAVVALVLALAYYGNSYHEVSYRAEMKEDGKVSLVDYTAGFLDRLEAKPGDREPILLVAADGGGLKACYWTMLQLYQLDSMGLFNDNVYLLSGASGGNMGLSMYTYLKGQQKPLPEIRAAIEEIGATNFLSGDFTGLIARFPVNFIPNLPGWGARDLEDRAEAMARAYFNIVGGKTGPYSYDQVREQPYAYLWQEVDYNLPLFISNTTRAEDGMRGVIHPLSNTDLMPGMIDLTARGKEAISFPDAAFLANRFPIMSPAGRIEGRGHFVDAGNSDNSGISTIMHVLGYLKANAASPSQPEDTLYQRFFDDHPIIMIGVRNDINRFVRDQFLTQKDALNRNFYRSELSANSNAAINSGVAGVPNSWDDYLRSDVPKKLGLVDEYHVIDLPFRLDETKVHLGLGGELNDRKLSQKVTAINRRVDAALGCAEGEGCFAVAPPLGRLMARPSVEYMRLMVKYPDNWAVFDTLSTGRRY
jgi:hypothetical protein